MTFFFEKSNSQFENYLEDNISTRQKMLKILKLMQAEFFFTNYSLCKKWFYFVFFLSPKFFYFELINNHIMFRNSLFYDKKKLKIFFTKICEK